MLSFELRAPFVANTITTSTLDGSTFTSGNDARFGNLSLFGKVLLVDREKLAISGGLGIALPTARDIRVSYADGTPLLNISNQSVRLQPFLGALYTPSIRFFAQGSLQFDVAANGNSVAINQTGAGLTRIGKLTDSSNLFFDAGIGYWAYRSDDRRGLTGIVPTLEIHKNVATQSGDSVIAGPFQVGNFIGTTG